MDYNPRWSGGSNDPSCTTCQRPITKEQRSVRIEFPNDPHGYRGMSGLYHAECAKPFQSLASAMDAMSFSRF